PLNQELAEKKSSLKTSSNELVDLLSLLPSTINKSKYGFVINASSLHTFSPLIEKNFLALALKQGISLNSFHSPFKDWDKSSWLQQLKKEVPQFLSSYLKKEKGILNISLTDAKALFFINHLHLLSRGNTFFKGKLYWKSDNFYPRPFFIELYRSYNLFSPAKFKRPLFFKELSVWRIKDTPLKIGWFLASFADDIEDIYINYLSSVKETAQLSDVLREERVYKILFTPTDFFLTSEKVDSYEVTAKENLILLTPFYRPLNARSVETFLIPSLLSNKECTSPVLKTEFSNIDGTTNSVLNSLGIIWAPRELLAVTIKSKVPFSSVEEKTIYFDKKTLLPVMKSVKGKNLSYFSFIVYEKVDFKGSEGSPYIPVLQVNISNNEMVLLIYSSYLFCKEEKEFFKVLNPKTLRELLSSTKNS
ncbi:MAG: hypothetical protein D6780_06205, partial [Candidatus Dadabacteria bacterium]